MEARVRVYCLDSWAVLRFLEGSTAAAHDATLLTGDPELTGRSVGCRVEDLRC